MQATRTKRRDLGVRRPRTAAWTAAVALAGCSTGIDLADCESTCGDGPHYVISSLQLVVADADGRSRGFDIDDRVSAGDRQEDCYTTDLSDPEGNPGIDNRLAELLTQTSPELLAEFQAGFRAAVTGGSLLGLVEFVGKLEAGSPSRPDLVVRYGEGEMHLDAQGKPLPQQSFTVADRPVASVVRDLRFDGAEMTGGPSSLRIDGSFRGSPVSVSLLDMRLYNRLSGTDMAGYVGGSVSLEDILTLLQAMLVDDPELYERTAAVLPLLMDVHNPATGQCERLSVALDVELIPAVVAR